MLDSKTLHDFLTANVHQELYPQLFVISRKGKLVAYSTTSDVAAIESEAALVAMVWREHSKTSTVSSSSNAAGPQSSRASNNDLLRALTVEAHDHNILVRPIQSNMLLVLIGGLPPGTSRPFKVVAETASSDVYPDQSGDLQKDVEALTSGSGHNIPKVQALRLQRKKLDILAETIMAEAKVVKVPEDP